MAEDDDDDGPGGGGRIASMAMEPILVRIEDGYYDDDQTTSGAMHACKHCLEYVNRHSCMLTLRSRCDLNTHAMLCS